MSIENVKKLEEGINKLCHWDRSMSNDDNLKIVNEGGNILDKVTATKDIDVLHRAFDYFIEEKGDNALGNGVCETLESEIFQNFTMEQIIEVLYKKFPALVENNQIRAKHFFGACMEEFDKLRDIFNQAKSANSEKFLKRFEKSYMEDYPEEIAILREDMGKW